MVNFYDIETLKSAFTITLVNRDTKEVKQFVIHQDKNDLTEMCNYILSLKGMIGFNVIGFDYPVIHYILLNYKKWTNLSNKEIIDLIYAKAQEIIEAQNSFDKSAKWRVQVKPSEILIPQLDLFRIWHFDNKARMTIAAARRW